MCGCVLDESGTDGTERSRKVASGRRVPGETRFLVNARDLQLECARIFHKTLLVPVLMYGSETVLWKEKERSRIRVVQIDNLRGWIVLNARIRELCGVKKGVDERIDKGLLQWFGHVERYRIAKRICVGECDGTRSLGRQWKRWIDTVKECLKKTGLYIRQARIEWWGFMMGNAWGMNP